VDPGQKFANLHMTELFGLSQIRQGHRA
jgi:hypothetical protein